MKLSESPPKFFTPFALKAGANFIRAIPQLSQIGVQDGAASFPDGFPPLNFTPLAQGGIPPFGQDFNGLFFQITKWQQQYQSGWPIYFDKSFCDSIFGYPKGAIVQSRTTIGLIWLSLVDDNTDDPDAGKSNKWVSFNLNGGVVYGDDVSNVPNIIEIDININELRVGLLLAIKIKNTNTGPITLRIRGLPDRPAVPNGYGGAQALGRDVVKEDVIIFIYDGCDWWFVPDPETRTSYNIQRGLPRSAMLVETLAAPTNFEAFLDPIAMAYNDRMTITFVPQMRGGATINQGIVRISINGLPYVPLLRDDGQELKSEDIRHLKPFVAAYYQGCFYMIGLSYSQVPRVLVGAIGFWVRPDGHDDTGDGTANTPDKAFRTIDGCWNAVGSRYAGSPTAAIYIMLGVPGDYEGTGGIGPFGASLVIHGDINNPAAYRIHSNTSPTEPGHTACILGNAINYFTVQGVTLVIDRNNWTAYGNRGFSCGRCSATLYNVRIVLGVQQPYNSTMCIIEWNSLFGDAYPGYAPAPGSLIHYIGNGFTTDHGFYMHSSSTVSDAHSIYSHPTWRYEGINFRGCGFMLYNFASFGNSIRRFESINCTGTRYLIHGTSIATFNGQSPPGSTAGVKGELTIVNP